MIVEALSIIRGSEMELAPYASVLDDQNTKNVTSNLTLLLYGGEFFMVMISQYSLFLFLVHYACLYLNLRSFTLYNFFENRKLTLIIKIVFF